MEMGLFGRPRSRAEDRGAPATRITIVGGRPPEDEAGREVPRGIDRVLARAALDRRFRDRLGADRVGALDASGVALSPAERGILLATDPEQLDAMVEGVSRNLTDRRGWFARVAGVFGVFVGGALVSIGESGCGVAGGTKGERPDVPPVSKGIRPDTPAGAKSEARTTTRK